MGAASTVCDEQSSTGIVWVLCVCVCVLPVPVETVSNLDRGRSGQEAWPGSLQGQIKLRNNSAKFFQEGSWVRERG